MKKIAYIITTLCLTLSVSSCMKEVALDSNSMLLDLGDCWMGDKEMHGKTVSQYILMQDGKFKRFRSNRRIYTAPEQNGSRIMNMAWGCHQEDFTLEEEFMYSIRGNSVFDVTTGKPRYMMDIRRAYEDRYLGETTRMELHSLNEEGSPTGCEYLYQISGFKEEYYTYIAADPEGLQKPISTVYDETITLRHQGRLLPEYELRGGMQEMISHMIQSGDIEMGNGISIVGHEGDGITFRIDTSDKIEGKRTIKMFPPGAPPILIMVYVSAEKRIVIWNAAYTKKETDITVDYDSKSMEFYVTGPQYSTFSCYSDADWITGAVINNLRLNFDIEANTSGQSRTGRITVSSSEPDIASAVLTITQTYSASAIITQAEEFTYNYEYQASENIPVTIENARNNHDIRAVLLTEGAEEWLTFSMHPLNGLFLYMQTNDSGASRSAQIRIEYYDLYSNETIAEKTITVTQTYNEPRIVLEKTEVDLGTGTSPVYVPYVIENIRGKYEPEVTSDADWISCGASDYRNIWIRANSEAPETRSAIVHINYQDMAFATINVTQRGSALDLSANGAANCYIVSSARDYRFSANYKGNYPESIGTVGNVEVLWESFGTLETPRTGALIDPQSLRYENGYIYFDVPTPFREGNAVIAVRNSSGVITWSWHLWLVEDEIKEHIYANGAGTVMDRNLGATSAVQGDVGALGLFYQWGRKDPFLGSGSVEQRIIAKATNPAPLPMSSTPERGTFAFAIQNPTVFITGNSGSNYDWMYSTGYTTRWNEGKSMYDPCPPGWKVPYGGEVSLWAKAGFRNVDSVGGCLFDDPVTGPDAAWYPATEQLDGQTGELNTTNGYGFHWSSIYRSYMWFFGGEITILQQSTRFHAASGYSVRCMKE